MEEVKVKIKKLEGFEDFILPVYSTPGACAVDLYAGLEEDFLVLWPGKRKLISS